MSAVSHRVFFVHPTVESSLAAGNLETQGFRYSRSNLSIEKPTDFGCIKLLNVYRLKKDYSMGLVSEMEYVFDKRKLGIFKLTKTDRWDDLKSKFELYEGQVDFINDHGYTDVTQDVLKYLPNYGLRVC